MNKIKQMSTLLLVLTALAACTHDENLTDGTSPDGGNTIRFTTTITDFPGTLPDGGTRATIGDDGTGTFTNGDQIMIIANDLSDVQNIKEIEHPATYSSGTWTTTMAWEEFARWAQVNFFAFFPKRALNELTADINLPTEQNVAANYAAADILYASAKNQTKSNQPIALAFRHIMHRLTVKLALADSPGTLTQADVDAATVVIKNMCTGGVFGNGSASPYETPTGDFTPRKSATGNTFYTILFPQGVTAGTPWIEVTVAGKTVNYPIPDGMTELQGGKEQVVNLKLTDSGVN